MTDTTLDKFRTVSQARGEVFDGYEGGIHCPVCNQFVKLYKRKLTSSMAYALILIHWYFKNNPEEKWLHVEKYLKSIESVPHPIRGDFHKLRYWKLIEKKKGEKEDGNPDVGYYAITDKGKEFVEKKIQVPKHVYIYNSEVKGFNEDVEIDIQNALGSKFQYDELMLNNLEDENE